MHNPWKYRILVNRKAPQMTTMHEAYRADPMLCLALWESVIGRAEMVARSRGMAPETHDQQRVRALRHFVRFEDGLGKRDHRDRGQG